jgi:hypothetical protein
LWADKSLWIVLVYSVLVGGMLASGWAFAYEWLKAWDIKYDVHVAQENYRELNVPSARKRSVVIPLFAWPLGAVIVAALLWHFTHFNWQTYLFIAVVWALTAPLRRFWLFAVTVRLDDVLFRKGIEPRRHVGTDSAFTLTLRYYQQGIRKSPPHEAAAQEQRRRRGLFIGRLAVWNKLIVLIKQLFRPLWWLLTQLPIRLFGVMLIELIAGLLWPAWAPAWLFKSAFGVAENAAHSIEQPWWSAFDEPLARPAPPPAPSGGADPPTLVME